MHKFNHKTIESKFTPGERQKSEILNKCYIKLSVTFAKMKTLKTLKPLTGHVTRFSIRRLQVHSEPDSPFQVQKRVSVVGRRL